MKNVKIIIALMFIGISTLIGGISIYANTGASCEELVSPTRNDVYEYRYSVINGIRCRRLWNATKGIWAEDEWSPCP